MHYLDVGALHRRYPGVRCDGIHFFSWHDLLLMEEEPYECRPSVGLWDGTVLEALEAVGLVRRCGCTTWHVQQPSRATHEQPPNSSCTPRVPQHVVVRRSGGRVL